MKHLFVQRPALKRTLLAAALALTCGTASAQFTWNPAGAGLAGSSFTADNISVSQFSTTTFTSATTFHEVGYLGVSSLQFAGQDIVAGGLNSTYSLYFRYTADGIVSGALSSFNYQLFATPSVPTFGPGGEISPVVTPVQLASGSLISGDTDLSNGRTLDATVTFNAASNPFFVSPPSSSFYDSMTLTTNAITATQTANGYMIDAGTGSANFAAPIPEPATYALMLAGLGMVGFVARRRKI